jgi:hypothetical protein
MTTEQKIIRAKVGLLELSWCFVNDQAGGVRRKARVDHRGLSMPKTKGLPPGLFSDIDLITICRLGSQGP